MSVSKKAPPRLQMKCNITDATRSISPKNPERQSFILAIQSFHSSQDSNICFGLSQALCFAVQIQSTTVYSKTAISALKKKVNRQNSTIDLVVSSSLGKEIYNSLSMLILAERAIIVQNKLLI
jgi:hypothetical protein